jgi:hypothetical protein
MPKTVTIKITKGFEIKPGSKYLIVLPKELMQDVTVYPNLIKLFEGAEFVGLAVKKPTDVKCFEIK